MKKLNLLVIVILLIIFFILWFLLYNKNNLEKFSVGPVFYITPSKINNLINTIKDFRLKIEQQYNPESVREADINKLEKVDKCKELIVNDSFYKNLPKIAECLSILPVAIRTTRINSKHVKKNKMFREKSPAGQEADKMRDLSDEELEAMKTD